MATQTVPLERARILVVEDDTNNRLVAVKLLQVMGVLPANIFETDSDAVNFLRARAPEGVDLILLDLHLPGKDGYTILQELRADPALANIPVVALTADVMRHDIERARVAGFNGFIGKPIDARRMSEWVQRLLAGEQVWTAS
jgi:two-component system cell cycle response regulator DivK